MRSSGASALALLFIAGASVVLVNCSGSGGNASAVVPHHSPSPSAATNVYVDNFDADDIAQYTPTVTASSSPAVTLSSDGALGVASDSTYVVGTSEGASAVSVWDQPVTSASETVATLGTADAGLAAFDGSGDLWLSVEGDGVSSVVEYAPPLTDSSTTAVTVTTDVVDPLGVALDSSQNLYVVDAEASPQPQLLVFASPYTGTPTVLNLPLSSESEAVGVAISGSIAAVAVFDNITGASFKQHPLAFKRAGALHDWAASRHAVHPLGEAVGGEILIYGLPIGASSTPTATIPLEEAGDLAFDSSGNLYVTDEVLPSSTGGVEVFTPPFTSASVPAFAVTGGIDDPLGINTGP
jgi:hypothetical protein